MKKHIFVFLAISIAYAYLHMYLRDFIITDLRYAMHTAVINGSAPAPIQYRILTPLLAELYTKIFGFKYAYGFLRGLFYFLSILILYKFYKLQINDNAVLGCYIFSAFIPFTYILYYYQETDPANLFFYILSYYIVSTKPEYLFFILPVAMLNRETPILIPLYYFIQRLERDSFKKVFIYSAIMVIECMAVYAALRFIYRAVAYSEFFYLKFNLTDRETYIFILLLFLPWIFSRGNSFSKRGIYFSAFFIVFHYIITIVKEVRLLLPVLPLYILHGLVPEKANKTFDKKSSYIFVFMLFPFFVLLTFGFYRITEILNIESWRAVKKPIEMVNEGLRIESSNLLAAVEKYETALLFAENYYLRERLCYIYLMYLYDEEKFLKHFAKLKESNMQDAIRKLEVYYEMQKNRFKVTAFPPLKK